MKQTKTKAINTINKVKKAIWTASMSLFFASMASLNAFAAGSADTGTTGAAGATTLWNNILDTASKYIMALAGILIVVGGINMGLGFKSEDSEGITRGVRTMVAGAIVAAVSAAGWGIAKIA